MKKILGVILLLSIPFLCLGQKDTFNTERELGEIKIQSTGKKSTDITVINTIRNSQNVSDGLSVEHIKKTPDRSVGDALRRVNGVTIQSDRFVLVRGLSDRYNVSLLNKSPLPTTEPDRRSFSFDIIPTGLIDNIMVVKSASANLPGDFAGGVVQITTKEVSNRFLNIGVGAGLGTLSTFKPLNYVPYVKFPSNFPSTRIYRISSNYEKGLYTRRIESPGINSENSIPNLNGNVSFGTNYKNWNALFSWNVRNSNSISYVDRLDYQTPIDLSYKYKDTTYTKNLSTNGLLNLSYIGKNRISLKTLFNHQIENNFLSRAGENWDNVQEVNAQSSNSVIKTIINTQLEGKVFGFNFNAGYNMMYRNQPDYRINPLTRSLGSNDKFETAWRDTYRFWSVLNETGINGNINRDIKNFKVGAGLIKRTRDFSARVFRYDPSKVLDEITNNTDRYDADFNLGNAYFLWDKKFKKVSINAGIRGEYNIFDVNTSDFSGREIKVEREYLDFLPSLNISYNLEKTKFRVSVSKTLSRPEFREVANFAYYDFVRNAQVLGNPKLEKTDIINLDAKFEWYPKPGENLSVSLFGKDFKNPIEQIVDNGSVPSNLILTYSNPNRAYIYGVEVEIRKKITSWFDFYTNGCLIRSEVTVNGIKRNLQGQSGYVVNSGLNIHKNKNTFNISYNRTGERISWVGFQGYGDIYENARDVFDIVYLYKIKLGEIKLSISDILAQPTAFYQLDKKQNLIKQQNERTISLTLNLNL